MTSDATRVVAFDVAIALAVPAALALTGLGVAIATGDTAGTVGFASTSAAGAALGAGAWWLHRRQPPAAGGRGALSRRAMAAAWVLAPALAAIPFWTSGVADGAIPATAVFASPLNALFEAMSGLTSTGLTVTPDAEALPHSLQWWRSLLQWVGGIGVLYLALALVPEEAEQDHDAELDAEMAADAPPRRGRRILSVWALYAGYTAAAALAFGATGMPAWEALNHGLTAMATGGFSITGDSFAGYGTAARAVCAVAMVMGAVSFATHLAVVAERRIGHVARDAQVRLGAALFVAGPLALWAAAAGRIPIGEAAFQWTSAFATAGFSTTDIGAWRPLPILLLVGAMVVGGAAGSTAGGFKLKRVAWLLGRSDSGDPGRLRRAALQQLGRVAAALGVGTVLLVALAGVAPLDALFEAASALSTVGLSTGATGPDLAPAGRVVLIVLMWAGRLEIAGALALVLRGFRTEPAP